MPKKSFFLALLFSFSFVACEDVISLDLDTAEPKLVIEAMLKLFEDGSKDVSIRITETAPFLSEDIPRITDAQVRIIDDLGAVFTYNHIQNGLYFPNNDFSPQPDRTYRLEVLYDNQLYIAEAGLDAGVGIDFVEQSNDGGFSGDDVQLEFFFTDPGDEANYYFFELLSEKGNVFDAADDQFFNGNQVNTLFVQEDLEAGDEVLFRITNGDRAFFDFIFTLLQQTEFASFGPFESQPATVRGNIINTTDANNFPFGYFKISEVGTFEYTVQ
ncbi:MAG: DUF4249 domain-containing protein [Flavobacteriaceae bacterium]|nr:DUF4249 domain-containing protein [Flavobacteriaceae bacterium]